MSIFIVQSAQHRPPAATRANFIVELINRCTDQTASFRQVFTGATERGPRLKAPGEGATNRRFPRGRAFSAAAKILIAPSAHPHANSQRAVDAHQAHRCVAV